VRGVGRGSSIGDDDDTERHSESGRRDLPPAQRHSGNERQMAHRVMSFLERENGTAIRSRARQVIVAQFGASRASDGANRANRGPHGGMTLVKSPKENRFLVAI
jgi:hypothetical protein